MAIRIAVNDHLGSAMNYELDQSLITFGRSKSCHVELDNPGVSRRHFLIRFIDDAYILMDENSRHGLLLDGEKILPHTAYRLAQEHEILLPGFSIQISLDGKKPKTDKTLVVMRNLLDELLHNEIIPQESSSLQSIDGVYRFSFVEEKASFVLGSWPEVDFFVNSPQVCKKHVSFARDINGIRLIPLPGQKVQLNGEDVVEPVILIPGSKIRVGEVELIYRERGESMPSPLTEAAEKKTESTLQPNKPPLLRALDRLFLLAFILVLAGASLLLFAV